MSANSVSTTDTNANVDSSDHQHQQQDVNNSSSSATDHSQSPVNESSTINDNNEMSSSNVNVTTSEQINQSNIDDVGDEKNKIYDKNNNNITINPFMKSSKTINHLMIVEDDDDHNDFGDDEMGILTKKYTPNEQQQVDSPQTTITMNNSVQQQQQQCPKSWKMKLFKVVNNESNDDQKTSIMKPIKDDNQSNINNGNNDQIIYESNVHSNATFPMFKQLMDNRQVCDVCIKVDDEKFYTHRLILCATIPYFYAMFTNDLLERDQFEIEIKSPFIMNGNENNDDNVNDNCNNNNYPSLTSESFRSILNYAYTGRISINLQNVQSLLIGSSYLGLINIQSACCDYLQNHINISNIIQIKQFASLLNCKQLIQTSKRFIYRNFEQITKLDDFLQIDFADILELISSDELNVSNEKIVFESLIRWLKFDEESRKQYLPELMEHIRLPLLYPEYLTDVVLAQKLIRESLPCRDLIDEAKDYHLLPSRRDSSIKSRERIRPRSGHHVQGSIYAVGGLTKTGDSISTVEVYDQQTKRWRMAEAMTMMRSRVGVAVMERKLYAIGGYNGFDRLNTVEVYDSKLKKWKRIKSMKYRRSAVGAASLNDELYVCGGYDGSISLNIVEKYISTSNEWQEITPMNIKRSAAGVVSLDGYIYALGGHDGLMIFNSVERYDPRSKKWEFVEPMQSRRCRLGCCCFGGKIYVCGGYDGCTFLQTAEVYDPQTGKWSYISKMRATRSRVALVANCSRLYAIGGYDGVSNLSSVETYDIEKDTWEMIASMVAHEGGVGVGVIPDNY